MLLVKRCPNCHGNSRIEESVCGEDGGKLYIVEAKVTGVFIFPNGALVVTDENGKQINYLQNVGTSEGAATWDRKGL
jgi:hypothetical protein